MSETLAPPKAAFPWIKINEAGRPQLVAIKCGNCGFSYAEQTRPACAKCGARDQFTQYEPAYTGVVHAATVVMRGFPGVEVPFVSTVVDLDNDGPVLKGSLRGVGFEPDAIQVGRKVKVVFDDALGRKDAAGNSYISHFFEPL